MTTQAAPPPGEPSPGYLAFERDREERLVPGQLVGAQRYRVVGELGMGGMAVVYEAEDLRTGRAVALKVVTRKYADKPDTAERYHNEIRLAAALDHHPHVVHPLEVGRLPELQARLYLATSLVRGRSLAAVVLEQPRGLELGRACRIGRDLARALVALHERGIIHRDVKPGNVMLEEQDGCETAKLLDFGCAYATGEGEVEASADLTQAHERVGSPIYMAPEQAIGLRPGPSFDLYAWGATMYEVLTGAPPYAGSSKAEVVQRKCAPDDPPRPVGRVRAGIPPRLGALVDGCLAREVEARPATARALLDELEGLAHGGHEARATASAPGRWRWLGAAAGVVVLVGVAALVRATLVPDAAGHIEDSGSAHVAPGAEVALDHGTGTGGDVALGGSASSGSGGSSVAGASETGATSTHGSSTSSSRDAGSTDGAEPPSREDAADPGPATPRPTPVASPPRWSTAECEGIRAKAVADRAARRWQPLLDAVTAERKCWRDADERAVLRAAALAGLGRYEECARLGARSNDRQLQRMVTQCQHKLAG